MMDFVWVVVGLGLLLGGGEALVRGAAGAAIKLGVSPLLIGLTVVGFGTSTPELVTSLDAAFAGSPGVSVGNIVGSNIANILLILGVSAMIFPLACARSTVKRDGTAMALAALAGLAALADGALQRWEGSLLVLALIGYIAFSIVQERRSKPPEATKADAAAPPMSLPVALAWALGGLVLVVLGADRLVSGTLNIARTFGVSETLLGLTVVAVGTSLPELATSIIAALKKQPDIALGNVIGSNIYNIFGILGATALIKPIPTPPEILAFDIWVMLAATALLILFAWTGARLSRWEGGVFLALYVAYIGWIAAT